MDELMKLVAAVLPQPRTIIDQDISKLENVMIGSDGLIKPILFKNAAEFTQDQISIFCVKYGLYQFPTVELIKFLQDEIGAINNAIEIGAGNGCIGRNVGVKMYDSYLQEQPDMKAYYAALKQPTIKYGKDVQNMDALIAIDVHRPETVIGCWITGKRVGGMRISDITGVQEEKMFSLGVKKYIHVGNLNTHMNKPIMRFINNLGVHCTCVHAPWLITRSLSYEMNVIHLFTKQ